MSDKLDLNSFAESIKSSVDIAEHIQRYEKLKLVGDSWQGPHSKHSDDKSDSTCFSINTEDGYFNCFSCGEGGDVIAYEASRLSETQVEAMKSLARDYNIEIPDLSNYESLSKEEKEKVEKKGQQIKAINEILKDYEVETIVNLTDNHIEYLLSRGLTEEAIEEFKLGYTPKAMTAFVRKYRTNDLIASGLFTESLTPVLADRITIPFRRSNKPIHFLGRAVSSNAEIKYLSQRSAREEINEFAISRSFWSIGNFKDKKEDGKTYKDILIVEGTMDALLAHQELGEDYIIVSCNTAIISKDQAKDLSRMLSGCSKREIIICNDSEKNRAGHKGAVKTIDKLTEHVREALIRSEGKKNKSSADEIKKQIDSATYTPRFMPYFSMAMLRRSPDVEKVDIADFISEGRIWELKKWISSAITVDYYKRYLIDDPDRFFGTDDDSRNNTFEDMKMVDELQWEGRFYIYQGETLYRYRDGVYIPDENMVSVDVSKKLRSKSKSSLIKRIVELLCATTGYIPPGFNIEESRSLVNTRSGWIDFSKMSLSENPKPHSPYRVSYAQINAEYDRRARCENVEKFLSEVLTHQDVAEFLKLSGYICTRETKFEKAFLFSGSGGNGKSTAIKVLQHFLGFENYEVKSLHSIEEDKFSTADLFGKLANFNTDLPARYVPDGENFKRIVTGDELSAQRKNKDPFKFAPECTLVFSANEIPRSTDTSYAYYRRWKFFAFDKSFTDGTNSQDRNLLDKLISPEEMSGLLNNAWSFYNMLEADEGFKESERSQEIMTEYQADNDIVNAFAYEFIDENSDGSILNQELYSIFLDFVTQRGGAKDRISQIRFNKRLRTLYGNKLVQATDHTQGNRKCWRGIDLKDEALNELDMQKQSTESDGVGFTS